MLFCQRIVMVGVGINVIQVSLVEFEDRAYTPGAVVLQTFDIAEMSLLGPTLPCPWLSILK